MQINLESLTEQLKHHIQGDVLQSQMERLLYSTDASSYQVMPDCIVLPKHTQDIQAVVKIAAEMHIPIIPRGGGSSLSGQTIGRGIVLDLSRYMNQVLELDIQNKTVWVQAGMALANLNQYLAPHGLKVGPDPASAVTATLGGMTGNNSTGSHSILYGMMVDHVKALDVVLSDASTVRFEPKTPEELQAIATKDSLESTLYGQLPQLVAAYRDEIKSRYPQTWRNVAGYNLQRIDQILQSGASLNLAPLIIGSEGTLGIITAVKVNLVPIPKHTYLQIIHFDTLRQSLETIPLILKHKPAAAELIDGYFNRLTQKSKEYAPQLTFIQDDPAAVLIVEFYADTPTELQQRAAVLEADLRNAGITGAIVHRQSPHEINQVWNVRKAGLGLLLSKRGDAKPLAFVDDATVPVMHLADYAQEVEEICNALGVEAAFYAHASAGCLHINPIVNPKTVDGLATMRKISESVMEAAIRYGGTTTGEHGEGFARSIYNEKLYGKQLHQAFRQVKGLFDPHNLMNPGKIIDAPAPWEPSIMRFNPQYATPYAPNTTFFDFSADGGFGGLVEMCNGQGVCRKTESGVMCPSYMATRDEAHSTRGRANALRAAMSGQLGADGLFNDELYDILDLCLGCKACKRECPSMVDMAKLKYEFLAQYQQEKGTPLRSWMFGNIALVNRLAALHPILKTLTNWSFNQPQIRQLLDGFLKIDKRRSLPTLAKTSFHEGRKPQSLQSPRGKVILWDDTFMTYNEPQIGWASLRLLEAIGYEVILLEDKKCCGRPLVSKGLLSQAIRHAEHNVKRLYHYAEQGIPVLGLEPSCIAMLKDEYPDLLRSEEAKLVAQNSYFIEEFIAKLATEGALDHLQWQNIAPQTLYVHGHCHQRALIGTTDMLTMLKLLPNTQVNLIDSGCCGMAGSFGYESEHYAVSMAAGEDRLFPTIRRVKDSATIVAPGTSCRHQIWDATQTHAVHPVVLLASALVTE